MDQVAQQPTSRDDNLELKLTLCFTGKAEAEYKKYWCDKHVHIYHSRIWIIIILYILLFSGMMDAVATERTPLLLLTYGSISIAFVIDASLSFIPKLNRFFEVYLGIGSFFSMAVAVITTYVVKGSANPDILFYAGMMLPVIVIFSFLGLSFYYGCAAVFGGLALGLGCVVYFGYYIDWPLFSRIMPATMVLGVVLSHSYEYIDRQSYIKAYKLEEAQIASESKNKQLNELAKLDVLTGLGNRRYMDENLGKSWAAALQGQPLSVFMIDIDFFKAFNDTFGHQAGDDCIMRVAKCVGGVAKRSGEFSVRYGGEEFLLVYPYDDEPQLRRMAELINEKVRQLEIYHPKSSVADVVTVSIGVASYSPMITPTLMDLIAHADTALYLAKESGRNGFVVYREKL